MTNLEILTAFELEINKIDDILGKPMTDDSLFWLNQAVNKFVKLRFNGDLVHHTGYEQTEKRREDLIHLVETWNTGTFYKNLQPSYDSYGVEYPSTFLYALSENVQISDLDDEHEMNTCVFECTQDSFMYRVNNSLTDFHYRFHRARPIRIRTDNGCKLLTDKKYKISKYELTYIKKPYEITLDDPYENYPCFEDNVIYEIVKMAAQMYLENKKDERYQTISNEVLTQE